MMKSNPFNFNKKIKRNYALVDPIIVDPKSNMEEKGCILIKDGVIKDFGDHINKSQIDESYHQINCENLYVCPGIVDIRAQIREPGLEHQETIKSASKSASSGGITSLVCMPNTNPVVDQPALIHSIQRK